MKLLPLYWTEKAGAIYELLRALGYVETREWAGLVQMVRP